MPKLVRATYRGLARKLVRAGYVLIRTSKHSVYYLASLNITIPVPRHSGEVPIGTLRAIVREMGLSVEEFNSL